VVLGQVGMGKSRTTLTDQLWRWKDHWPVSSEYVGESMEIRYLYRMSCSQPNSTFFTGSTVSWVAMNHFSDVYLILTVLNIFLQSR